MQLNVKGRNLQVTDGLFNHAEKRLSKLTRRMPPWDDATSVELELSVERGGAGRQVAEVTVHTKGPVLRARDESPDMYAAIDGVTRKLERQARRYRDRREARRRSAPAPEPVVPEDLPPVAAEEPEEPAPVLVKRKSFEMKPMSLDDALLQLELLDHAFYVYRDAVSDEVQVVYRRRDGDIGLISPA